MALGFLKNMFGARKAETITATLGELGTDVHSHLLPGIDDGAKDMSYSISYIRFFQELGYSKLITTPHIMVGAYNNTPAIINQKCKDVQNEIAALHIPITLEAAAEYYFDDQFQKLINKEEIPLTFGKNYLLFELPASNTPAGLKELIFKMNLDDYRPVLAHPERYVYMHDKKLVQYEELKEYNVLFQANIMSFSGHYGKNIKQAVELLANAGLIDMVGSDFHNERHCEPLSQALESPVFQKLLSSGKLLNQTL